MYLPTVDRAEASTMTEEISTMSTTTASTETMTEPIEFCVAIKDTDIESSTSDSSSNINFTPTPSDHELAAATTTKNSSNSETQEILSTPDAVSTLDDFQSSSFTRQITAQGVHSPNTDQAGDLPPQPCLPTSAKYKYSTNHFKPTPAIHVKPESSYNFFGEASWPPFGPDIPDVLLSLAATLGPAPSKGCVPDTFRGGGQCDFRQDFR